jgi:hypothetical protein
MNDLLNLAAKAHGGLAALIGLYSMVAITLNAFDVPAAERE